MTRSLELQFFRHRSTAVLLTTLYKLINDLEVLTWKVSSWRHPPLPPVIKIIQHGSDPHEVWIHHYSKKHWHNALWLKLKQMLKMATLRCSAHPSTHVQTLRLWSRTNRAGPPFWLTWSAVTALVRLTQLLQCTGRATEQRSVIRVVGLKFTTEGHIQDGDTAGTRGADEYSYVFSVWSSVMRWGYDKLHPVTPCYLKRRNSFELFTLICLNRLIHF